MLLEYPLHELQSEAAKPVSIGDDNFSDSARVASFQNGTQSGSLPVEPRADVADDLVVRVRFLEVGDLAVEVRFLVLGGDAAVDDVGPRLWCGCWFWPLDELEELLLVVHAFASGHLDTLEFAVDCPASHGGRGDADLSHASKLDCRDICLCHTRHFSRNDLFERFAKKK
jgi:hypothetical protein